MQPYAIKAAAASSASASLPFPVCECNVDIASAFFLITPLLASWPFLEGERVIFLILKICCIINAQHTQLIQLSHWRERGKGSGGIFLA